MRTYGRTQDVITGKKTWWLVQTDFNGFNDSVYLTALAQVLKLNLGESPFFANYGIPAHQSVVTQVYPNYYLARTQQQFAGYFASLILTPLQDAVDHLLAAIISSIQHISSYKLWITKLTCHPT